MFREKIYDNRSSRIFYKLIKTNLIACSSLSPLFDDRIWTLAENGQIYIVNPKI